MGIFSFLSGSKTEELDAPAAPPPQAPPPSVAMDPPAAPANPAAGFHSGALDSPFHPPEAWNIEALTAPKPETGDKPRLGPLDAAVTAELQPKVVEAAKTVFDPEIPVDIYELGLIYGIEADADHNVLVNMTLTSPACPSAQQLPSEVRYKVKAIPGVKDAWVEIVWEPPWDKDRMSEAAKLQLGFF
jgi:FeS assembly SUF system protein